MERLLHETFASVGWNILRLIWVSLKKGGKLACARLASFRPSHPLMHLFL
jgi:hypothetical protein